MQSLMRAAKDSIKIMVSLIPVFVVAAFFESFVTRHTDMPVWLSLSILLLSGAFIAWYYILYPIKISKRVKQHVPVS